MIYQGKALSVGSLDDGLVELVFDAADESVNKFNQATLKELSEAVSAIKNASEIKGVMIRSAKEAFIVGADITEFLGLFAADEATLIEWVSKANEIFCALEDLPCPTVCLINGFALGGGLEVCLATDYRIMAETAEVGLPEVKLGIFPGFGGTVRMPRVIGVDNAAEWIAAGGQHKAPKALADGVVDAVVPAEQLIAVGTQLLKDINAGKLDYQAKRAEKLSPLKLTPLENMMAFQTCTAMVKQKAGKHYPAPVAAMKTMQKHASMNRDAALEAEAAEFAKMAKTEVAKNLVGLFLSDQLLKKQASKLTKDVAPIKKAGVLGAGIMGGGIAYQSAYKGTPIIMKDISEDSLDLGMAEASKLLNKRVSRGRMTSEKMAAVLSKITPTLSYGDFAQVDVVVEAVVEKQAVKKAVLAEVEDLVSESAILASNTSTISITELAKDLKRPEQFVGMHFFNPVHRMPLVEVIRGEKSSEAAVAAVVSYAKAMGKTPIVVNDCPGFLVNRVLFPYLAGFNLLLKDGADFQQIDKVMEGFGWPMGPAYLLDVVGIDTGVHAAGVLAEGFPDRMKPDFKDATTVLFEQGRLGQKSELGFYQYTKDKKGKPKKVVDESVYGILESHVAEKRDFEKQDIIDRLMVPMCLETIRCLDEGIVASPTEADMALIMGLGFPPFRGGALKYVDDYGVKAFAELCDRLSELGPMYQATDSVRAMAEKGETFYKA